MNYPIYVCCFFSGREDTCICCRTLQVLLSLIRKKLGRMLVYQLRRSPRLCLLRDEREIESQNVVDSSPLARRIV